MTDALGRQYRGEARTGLTLARRRLLAMAGLERSLMGGRPVSPQDDLRSLIAELDRAAEGSAGPEGRAGTGGADVVEATWDRYGDGGPVAALEEQVAALLGKPAAVMFLSGIMAQQSVLRVWSDVRAAGGSPYRGCRTCCTTSRTDPGCSTTSSGPC